MTSDGEFDEAAVEYGGLGASRASGPVTGLTHFFSQQTSLEFTAASPVPKSWIMTKLQYEYTVRLYIQ